MATEKKLWTFDEVARRCAKDDKSKLTTYHSVLARLCEGLWLGQFEDQFRQSRLFQPCTIQDRRVDAEPPRRSRRQMITFVPKGEPEYSKVDEIRDCRFLPTDDLSDDDPVWNALARVHPEGHSPPVLRELKQLRISRGDLLGWAKDYSESDIRRVFDKDGESRRPPGRPSSTDSIIREYQKLLPRAADLSIAEAASHVRKVLSERNPRKFPAQSTIEKKISLYKRGLLP